MIENLPLVVNTFESESDNRKAAAELSELRRHPGWLFLEKVLQLNVERLGTILLGEDPDNRELNEQERQLLKLRRLDLKKLLAMPRAQIKVLEGQPLEPEDDPYYSVEQFTKASESGAKK